MSNEQGKTTRLLFFAWGYSIHAYRRIKVFAEDPAFEVALISNHIYTIPKVTTYPLFCASTDRVDGVCDKDVETKGRISVVKKVFRYFSRFLLARLVKDIAYGVPDALASFRGFRKFCPDVIFLQTLLYPCYLSYFLPRKIPLVITFWNGDVTWWAKWNGIERLFKKWLVTHGVNRSKVITVNSQSAYNACLNYGAPEKKVHLIRYPGVDLNRFKPADKQAARKHLGVIANHVVLCPRGLAQYLNSDIIIRALAHIVEELPGVTFLFVSGASAGERLEYHKQLCRDLGVENNVQWVGQVPWEQMPDYYNASNLMISISSKDSLPNCMLESMACGVPVVMGDIPEIREWVVDGVNGVLTPTRNPKMLAFNVLRILKGENSSVELNVAAALEKVRAEVDAEVNGRLVIDLVRGLTHDSGPGGY